VLSMMFSVPLEFQDEPRARHGLIVGIRKTLHN
jgi:hypothetical protein